MLSCQDIKVRSGRPLNSTKPGPISLDRVTKGPKSSGDTFSLPENPSTLPLKTEYFLENNRDEN